ncbi:asparaginase [Alphaproteobacteria bacterium GH1-50]|uniref:Asparaginase n=1 Tax=Kangsaoukella pontilimi TaxID=2691042 RepID=A0A7C9MF88_9RHOB|nr:asparaginase [Kangsaoukella pontilimi]MXQ09371.1 asparaginase [Kangsaoukella pontilimi]
MSDAALLAEVTRGEITESVHRGHAAIVGPDGALIDGWGDPDKVILPRSSCKMIQALPLLESGAGRDLDAVRLALASASHEGEPRHVELVSRWLGDLGLGAHDLLCGPEASRDPAHHDEMIRAGEAPTRVHNNCSGKHTGFLMLARHLGAGPDYVEMDHPVQKAVRAAFEEVTGAPSPGWGIDGCSAPNFATTLRNLAGAMARFATAIDGRDARQSAMVRLREAMMAHPGLVSGRLAACKTLMDSAPGRFVAKTGAEGVYTAILPERGIGIAVKIDDGAKRASTAVIAALLVRVGAVSADAPGIAALLAQPVPNRMGVNTGHVRPVAGLTG